MTDVLITEIPPEGVTQLPMLYARTSTGAIQVWMIQILGDKYRTISGQSDGKKATIAPIEDVEPAIAVE